MKRNRIRYGAPPRKRAPQSDLRNGDTQTLEIERLSLECRGIGKLNGKTVFVRGALPGEEVDAKITATHKRFDEAELIAVNRASDDRVTPPCPHFATCGGCDLQYLAADKQREQKEQLVLDQLRRFANVEPEQVEPAIISDDTGYRRTARIGINQRSDGTQLIGFRRRNSNKLTDIDLCPVLEPQLNKVLGELRTLLADEADIKRLTHADLSAGDNSTLLTLRITRTLPEVLEQKLSNWAQESGLNLALETAPGELKWLNQAGETTFCVDNPPLALAFTAGDFLQINADANRQMIDRAISWLAPTTNDSLLDLFCGLGNFTLALARRCSQVTGIEGSERMVKRATSNAQRNAIDNVNFQAADLTQTDALSAFKGVSAILLDPPRTGAADVIAKIASWETPKVLYIACNPSSLVRDAQTMAKAGYRMSRFAVTDMFPHTSHIESMALFER